MADLPRRIQTWQMSAPAIFAKGPDGERTLTSPGKLRLTSVPPPHLGPGQALVKVAGCGVCRTDLGYFYDGVPTVQPPPLTLGHEISGTVAAGPEELVGKQVIVPAVMPCGDCELCASGRGNRCLAQQMPGNSLGIYGGFASHVPVPARDLCVIEELKLPLSHYAVLADAVTTPYQAAMRARIGTGDRVVIIGAAGGLGVYATQIVKALGARVVVGVDLSQPRLERALQYGADYVINTKGKDIRAIKAELARIAQQAGVPAKVGWKIFEISGSATGQETALSLLSFAGMLIVLGFGLTQSQYMISKLMAFDAQMIGVWGCLPEYYPKVLELVQSGQIQIEPFLETKPMSRIQQVFEQQHAGLFDKRQVLEPDF